MNSGLTGKKNSHSMISAAFEDFFKPSAGNVDSENVLSDHLGSPVECENGWNSLDGGLDCFKTFGKKVTSNDPENC